jgi:hypothetical protein
MSDAVDLETRAYLYDAAMDIGGIRDTGIDEWARASVEHLRKCDREHDATDRELHQAALDAAAETARVIADEGPR